MFGVTPRRLSRAAAALPVLPFMEVQMNKTKHKAARPQPAPRGPEMVKIPATEYEKLLEIEDLARQITFDAFLCQHPEDWVDLLHSRMRAEMKALFDPARGLTNPEISQEVETVAWETLEQIKLMSDLKRLQDVVAESNV